MKPPNAPLRRYLRSGLRLSLAEPELRTLALIHDGQLAAWSGDRYNHAMAALMRKGLVSADAAGLTVAGKHVVGLAVEAGILTEVLADELAIARAKRARPK